VPAMSEKGLMIAGVIVVLVVLLFIGLGRVL
jgi:hypothetical protein